MSEFVLHDGYYATSSLERWPYPCRSQSIHVSATTLDRALAGWERLDLVKIDAEGAETLVWEGTQQTLRLFPQAVVVLDLHLQCDPPQAINLAPQVERTGYGHREILQALHGRIDHYLVVGPRAGAQVGH